VDANDANKSKQKDHKVTVAGKMENTHNVAYTKNSDRSNSSIIWNQILQIREEKYLSKLEIFGSRTKANSEIKSFQYDVFIKYKLTKSGNMGD
jgi:hypothetical protein